MLNSVKKIAVLLAAVFVIMTCASKPQAAQPIAPLAAESSVTPFSQLQNKDWYLIAVRTTPEIDLDRDKLAEEGFGEFFTLRFDGERASGIGAPNRYTAPYTHDGQGLSIGHAASTMMAAFREPEQLKEHEFFAYLQNTVQWNLADGKLELHTKKSDATGAILVFTERE